MVISTPDLLLNCTGTCPVLNSTLIGGSGNFAFQWYNNSVPITGATEANFTACFPGTYNLSVTDITNNCNSSSNLLVILQLYPIVTISTPDTLLNCTGICPVLNATILGGIGPLELQWFNNSVLIAGATDANLTACSPGTYSLLVTNLTSNCTNSSNSITIDPQIIPLVTITTPDTLLNCTGVCPVLNATILGGIGPLELQWYNNSVLIAGATDANLTVCSPGTYSLLVTNLTSNCTNSSNSINITLAAPLVTISTPDTLLNCTGICPVLNATILGGIGPLELQWFNNSVLIAGATDANLTVCYPGNYSLLVTNLTSNCTNSSNSINISASINPLVTISTPDTLLNCTGVCPVLNATILGGPGPLELQWYNNSVLIAGATDANLTVCSPGTYSLLVTNLTSNCTNSSNAINITLAAPLVTISTPDTLLNCTGICPVLNATILGGLGPLELQWYNNSVLIAGATEANFTACYPGTYSLLVTNLTSNCNNSSNSLVIDAQVLPIVTISTPDALLNCTGTCPILNAAVLAGIGPFTFQWFNNSVLIAGATEANFTACYPGTYSLLVTNITSNCTNSSNSLVIDLAAPLILISTPDTLLNCTGICPVLNATAIAGLGPFAFQWYNNSVLIAGATEANFTACYPGTYNLSVTNITSNCTNSSNSIVIDPRVFPIVTITTPDTLLNCTACPILNSIVIDGTGPFAFQWYNNSVLIAGATGANFTACYPGTYSLSVTNTTSNCTNGSNSLVIDPQVFPLVAISTADTLLNCTACPILNSIVIDGTGPFAFQWYNNSVLIAGATGANFTACYPGTYNLSVTNTSNGCSNISNLLVITARVVPQVSISTPDTLLNCTGPCPELNSTVSDGPGPFTYQWYNDSILIPGATDSNFTACHPGTYSLSVTNITNNCSNSSNPIVITLAALLVVISTPDAQLNCTGPCPILNSTVTDSTGPFAYQWYNDSVLIVGATNASFTACYPGTYNLSVTNTSSGCSNSSNLLVIDPRVYPLVTISTPDTLLNCTACPILNSTVIDGVGPFAYQWFNNSTLIPGAIDSSFTACYPGIYNLSVTNTSSGCNNSSNLLIINARVVPQVSISTPDTLLNCTGTCPILNSTVTDGTGPFAYEWYNNSILIPGATNSNFTACYPGSYSLAATNITSNCTNSSNLIVITLAAPLVVVSTPDALLNCTGLCPILNSTVSDGPGPFVFQWYNDSILIPGATDSNFTACYPGTYSLAATNTTSNCTNSSNLLVIKLAAPLVIISTPDAQLNCTGICPILNSAVTDGLGPFAYQWYNDSVIIPGATGSDFTACYPGNYSLSVTNTTSNCTNSSNLLVIAAQVYPLVIISTPDTLLNCTGPCPILNSAVTDGSGPFAYQWFNNSILIPGATNSNFTACYPGTYNLSVINTSSGCSNSSNLLVIAARVVPQVNISTPDAQLNCTACPILSSTVTGGSGPFAYQWYNNSVLIAGATEANFIACYPGTYNLSVTNISSGCSNSSNLLVIDPGDYPLVAISTPDTLLNCTGICPILDSTVTDGAGPFDYQWYNDSVFIPGATGSSFTACYPGTYSLSVTNTSSNCTNSSNSLVIEPQIYPLVTIATPDTLLNCSGPCPILSSIVTDGSGPFAYQWYNNSVLIAGASNDSFTACYPGTYNLSVTNTTSGCTNRSNPLVIVDTCKGLILNKSDNTGGHLVGEGETIAYTYKVTNSGTVNLTNVTLTDDRVSNIVGPIDPNNDGKLNPGETWTFTGSYKVKFSDLGGVIVNTALAEAVDPSGGLIESNAARDSVSTRPPMEGPTQYEQFCEAKKVSGEGVIDSGTSIIDKRLGLEYNNVMAGEGDLELDQEQAYSQNPDKLKRNISSVNGGNQSNLNLFERQKLAYSGDTPLTGGKYLHSKEFYGGIGADVQEMFSVNQMEKDQTAFFSTIPEEALQKKGAHGFAGQLNAAGRNTSRVSDLMGNNSAYLVGLETKNTFNGTWGTDATWHRIFFKDIKSHQMFTGKFEAEKTIKFHENPVPEKENAPCEGIDC